MLWAMKYTTQTTVSQSNQALDAIEAERAAPGYEAEPVGYVVPRPVTGADWQDEVLEIPAFLRRQAE